MKRCLVCPPLQVVLAALERRFMEVAPFEGCFYISAMHGHGVPQLKRLLLAKVCVTACFIMSCSCSNRYLLGA